MTLDLEDPDGGKDKLGQICAIFTVQPKNYEDRQEVCVCTVLFGSVSKQAQASQPYTTVG